MFYFSMWILYHIFMWMSTPNSNNIALNHTSICIHCIISCIFFTKSTVFRVQTPHFYVYSVSGCPSCVHDFNGKAPLKICYLKKVYYLYTPCERSLRSLVHGCSQNSFVLRLNVNAWFKQYCTKSRGLVCIYRTTSRIFFTKSTVFRVQTSHFYVYCFNKSAYPYVEIPTVMSV